MISPMAPRIVAVTGHRAVHADDRPLVVGTIRALVEDGVDQFFFGGALGVDSIALEGAYVATLDGKGRKPPKLTVVVPDRVGDQPRLARLAIVEFSTNVIELHNKISAVDKWKAFRLRNQYMVDHATEVFAFLDRSNRPSGTRQCVAYAERMKKPVHRVYLDKTGLR